MEEIDSQEESIEGIKYYERTVLFTPNLWKTDASMRKYVNNFIKHTWFHIDQYNYHWYTKIAYINNLTLNVIEVLKKNKGNVILIFNSSFIDRYRLLTMLPEHIQYIILDGTSNMTFDEELYIDFTNLPRDLIYLNIGYKFNYLPTLDYLPLGLKVLRLGEKLDVPIDHLPQGLEILEIGRNFNHPVDNLPDSIRILIFKTKSTNRNFNCIDPYYYLHKINRLPQKLEVLIFDYVQDEVICDIDFSYLTNLTYIALPNKFDEVSFFNASNLSNPGNPKWPPNLKKLHIGKTYNNTISELPPSLECLVVHQNFDLETNLLYVPSNLKEVLVDVRNQIIQNIKCHYGTFKQIQKKFPGIKVEYLRAY